jgi:hypothetical protein
MTTLVRRRRQLAAPVINLAAWREARDAAEVLHRLLGDPAWLRSIGVQVVGVHPFIIVRLALDCEQALLSTPTHVNGVPTVVFETSGRTARQASARPQPPPPPPNPPAR